MDAETNISIEKRIDDKEWLNFIKDCNQKDIFQTPYMRDVFEKTQNYQPFCYFARDETNEIVASLLAYTIRDNVPLSFFSRRGIVEGGPLFLEKENGELAAKLLVEEFYKEMKKHAIFAEIRNHRLTQNFNSVFQDAKFNFIEHLNILINLTQGKEVLWKSLHKKRRNGIRRSLKRGASCKKVNTEDEMKELYGILQETYKQAKIPLADESLFLAIVNELVPINLAYPLIIQVDDTNIGGIVPLLFAGKIFDWYAGGLRNYTKYCPNDLAVWHLLEWGASNSYTIFDFGGAGNPNEEYGVRNFKMQFGGEVVNFGRYHALLHPYYFKISQIGFKFWKKISRFT